MNSDKTIGIILDGEYWLDARVRNYTEQLATAGFKLKVLCFPSSPPKNEYIELLYANIEFFCVKPSWFTYKSSALAYELPFYHRWCKNKARAFHEEHPCDLWHVNDIRAGLPFITFAKANGIKCVIDLHEIRPEIMRHYAYVKRFPNKYLVDLKKWKRGEQICIETADKTIVVTESAKRFYELNYKSSPSKIHVVPNSVSRNFQHSGERSGIFDVVRTKHAITYIGDTSERRGLLTAIEAMSEIVLNNPKAHLFIIGTSSFDEHLKNRVQQLELNDHVTFLGWIDSSYFPEILSYSSIGICLLHRNAHHDTTLANKIMQYASIGLPQIVSDCPAQAELVKQEKIGLVVRAEDHQEFSNAVGKLLSDSELSDTLGKNGTKLVRKKYNWEVIINDLIEVYHKLTSSTNI